MKGGNKKPRFDVPIHSRGLCKACFWFVLHQILLFSHPLLRYSLLSKVSFFVVTFEALQRIRRPSVLAPFTAFSLYCCQIRILFNHCRVLLHLQTWLLTIFNSFINTLWWPVHSKWSVFRVASTRTASQRSKMWSWSTFDRSPKWELTSICQNTTTSKVTSNHSLFHFLY